nr:Ty3/gypsy retrotransposon protein [Tanacetum cinerariifolium]
MYWESGLHLELPPGSRIHPVFHVSLLKPSHGNLNPTTCPLPDKYVDNFPVIKVEAFLDHRTINKHGKPEAQVLVKWKGRDIIEATWEPRAEMTIVMPYLEDKVLFEDRDIDTYWKFSAIMGIETYLKMGLEVKGLKTEQKRVFLGLFRSRVLNIQDEDEVVESPRACHWKEHEITVPTVKEKQENEKIGTKPDQIKKKHEAWKSRAVSKPCLSQESRKEKKI